MEKKHSSFGKLAPPSKIISSKFDNAEGAKETEIAAQITLPKDGGWGWVVLTAAFCSVGILDGLVFTFGALLNDIANDLDVQRPMVALVGSLDLTLYLMFSPIASSFINKFGFRICGMLGGMICCFSVLSSTFSRNYATFLLLYGVCQGIGASFTSMAAYLIVGLYFHKYRTVTLIMVTTGSSVGIMSISPMNIALVKLAGWRPTVLLHSGLLGLIFFFSLTYKPLVSLTVANTEDAAVSARTVTFIPNEKPRAGEKSIANATERILGAVSNTRYPTAASIIQDPIISPSSSPHTSSESGKPRVRLSTTHGISKSQLKQVRSIQSKGTVADLRAIDIEIQNEHHPRRKKSCWGRLCHWPSHVKSARPLYRDDAFYDGKMNELPQYRKVSMDTGDKLPNQIGYQMEVSRAVTVDDLNDRHGLCTTAVTRVLATMFNIDLLKMNSFIVLCLAGVCNYLGLLTPVTYLQDRNLENGVNAQHCKYFVSVIGCFNGLSRVMWCILSTKISPTYLYSIGLIIAGISTMISGFSYSLAYQYGYCMLYGSTISVSNCMRSLMIVDLYGLQALTSGTGVFMLFMGVGNIFSTPVAGVLRNIFGYDSAFYFAGFFFTLAGVLSFPIKIIRSREINKTTQGNLIEIRKREILKPKIDKESSFSQDPDIKKRNRDMSPLRNNSDNSRPVDFEYKQRMLKSSLQRFSNYSPSLNHS